MKKIKTLFLFMLIISIVSSCNVNLSAEKLKNQDRKEDIKLAKKLSLVPIPKKFISQENNRSYLKTGWYIVTDDVTKGIPKDIFINGQKQIVYIDSNPQLTPKDIEFFYLTKDQNDKNVVNLVMYFNEQGTEKWATLTNQLIRRKLAFVINNVVEMTPMVQSQITNGVSVLWGNVYTPDEMYTIKKLLERQKNE